MNTVDEQRDSPSSISFPSTFANKDAIVTVHYAEDGYVILVDGAVLGGLDIGSDGAIWHFEPHALEGHYTTAEIKTGMKVAIVRYHAFVLGMGDIKIDVRL